MSKPIYATTPILVGGVHHDEGQEIKGVSDDDRRMLLNAKRAAEEVPAAEAKGGKAKADTQG